MSYGVQSAGLASLFGDSSPDGTSGTSLRPFANLDLSEDQRSKIRSILKSAKTDGLSADQVQQQINGVLTSAQQAQLAAGAASNAGGGPPGGNPFSDPNGPFANLNLTSAQQSQISTILSGAKSQGLSIDAVNAKISATLTASQQATFTQDLQRLPPPSGPPPNGSSPSASSTGDSSSTDNLFANLNLTTNQKSQIDTILTNAKKNGTSSSDTLAQIEDVLTSSQQGIFFEDVQNAQASVSGLFSTSSGDGTATSSTGTSSGATGTTLSSGVSESDVQNQIAAANALILQQLQNEAGVT
jgi:Spy/CpxP family protein refolding chaperone